MKRKILNTLLVSMLAMFFIGCGNNAKTDDNSEKIEGWYTYTSTADDMVAQREKKYIYFDNNKTPLRYGNDLFEYPSLYIDFYKKIGGKLSALISYDVLIEDETFKKISQLQLPDCYFWTAGWYKAKGFQNDHFYIEKEEVVDNETSSASIFGITGYEITDTTYFYINSDGNIQRAGNILGEYKHDALNFAQNRYNYTFLNFMGTYLHNGYYGDGNGIFTFEKFDEAPEWKTIKVEDNKTLDAGWYKTVKGHVINKVNGTTTVDEDYEDFDYHIFYISEDGYLMAVGEGNSENTFDSSNTESFSELFTGELTDVKGLKDLSMTVEKTDSGFEFTNEYELYDDLDKDGIIETTTYVKIIETADKVLDTTTLPDWCQNFLYY